MRYLLGLDIGTSGTKTALFDELGNTIETATYGYDLYQPQAGWAEQNPEDWWEACLNGIKDVVKKSKVNSSDIKGIGLSGQMHGLVLVDKHDKVIRNSIIWCDQRTEKQCEACMVEEVHTGKPIQCWCGLRHPDEPTDLGCFRTSGRFF